MTLRVHPELLSRKYLYLKTPLFLLPKQLLNELSNMQLSVSEQQEGSQRLQQEMRRQLQDKEQTIRTQREQVGTRSRPQPDYAERRK